MVRQTGATLFQGTRPSAKVAASSRWWANPHWERLSAFLISRHLEHPAIVAIKLVHTLIFAALMSCVVYIGYAGAANRMSRRSVLALVTIIGEGVVIARNEGRCPLTDMVEELGDEHGSVSDIFLPNWVARHIPHLSCAILGIGMAVFGMRRFADQFRH